MPAGRRRTAVQWPHQSKDDTCVHRRCDTHPNIALYRLGDMDARCTPTLSALPPELSVHLAGFLTLADAHALSLTQRHTPVAASEVLCGERVAHGRLVARPDAADLLRRVGLRRLCRAWGLSDGRPHAALCNQLQRRLGHAPDESGGGLGEVPFAVATCDAPGSLTLVYGANGPDRSRMLRTAAGIAADATGRRPALTRPPGENLDRRWAHDTTAAWRAVEKTDAQLLVHDPLCLREDEWMCECERELEAGLSVALAYWCFSSLRRSSLRRARTVVVRDVRCVLGLDAGHPMDAYLGQTLDTDARRELRAYAASLKSDQWLVIDLWLRRWQRWTPPDE